MLAVLHVGPLDVDLAVLQLRWTRKLCGRTQHRVLISTEDGVDTAQLRREANRCFAEVSTFSYTPHGGNPNWPHPQNWGFQQTAKLAPLEPGWLWWEPDATPLHPEWLDILEQRYKVCDKPFLGLSMPNTGYLNGVALYPQQVAAHSRAMLMAGSTPFDMADGPAVAAKSAFCNDIMRMWVKKNGPRSFTTREEAQSLLKQGLVLYHGADQSLPSLLLKLPPPKAGGNPTPGFVPVGVELSHPKIYLCSGLDTARTKDEDLRNQWALSSWKELDNVQILLWKPPYPRDSRSLQDNRQLPYINDILGQALHLAKDHEIIAFSNSDTAWCHEAPSVIRKKLQDVPAVEVFRTEFTNMPSPKRKAHDLLAAGREDVGRDGFAFRAGWWRQHFQHLPDMFHGEELWDLLLSIIIRQSLGLPVGWEECLVKDPKTALPGGYLLHKNHDKDRVWCTPQADELPAKKHNRAAARDFFHRCGLKPGPHFS